MSTFVDYFNQWKRTQTGKSLTYEYTLTYSGSADTLDLPFDRPVQINRFEQIWNDATARDFSVRLFTNPSSSIYSEIDARTSSTATSRIIQLGNEYKFPAGTLLRFYYASNTAAKTVSIRVQVDEI